jgi:TonB family protein
MLPVLMLALALQEAPSPTTQPPAPLPDVEIAADPRQGAVVLDCAVRTDGRLHDCRIVSERPRGRGFGQVALAGARRARVAPRPERNSTDEPRVTFTTYFALED